MRFCHLLSPVLIGLLVVAPPTAMTGGASDTYESRVAAAKRYLEVSEDSLRVMIQDSIGDAAKSFPEDLRHEWISSMNEHIPTEELRADVLSVMAKHFTVEELGAMADFYGSKEGQSVLSKFGAYLDDVYPVIEQHMRRTYSDVEADIERIINTKK